MHPLVKKLAGQTAIYGLTTIVGRFLNYLLVPLHTAVFQPAAYGVVTELYAYVSFLNILFTYGMETAYFRFASLEHNKRQVFDTAMVSLLISTVLLTLPLILFAHPIADAMEYNNHPEYIQWFALILGLDALCAIPFGRLRMEDRPKAYSFFKLLNIGVNIGLNLFFLLLCPWLIKNGYNIHGIYSEKIGVGYVFISNLIASAVTLAGLSPFFIRKKYEPDFSQWKKMFRYAAPLIIVGLAGMVNETFDRILLKYLLPYSHEVTMAQIGIYGACYKLSLIMTLFVQAYKMAAEPFFFNESNRKDAKIIYARTMNYFVIVCSVIFVGILLFLDFIKYFINERYFSGLGVVPILMMANLCLGVYYNLTVWYKLTNQTRIGAYIAVLGAVVTLTVNYFLIPVIGFMGSAWATFLCYAVMMTVSYFQGQHYYRVPYDVRKFVIYISAALVFYFAGSSMSSRLLAISDFLYVAVNLFLLSVFLLLIYGVEKKLKNPEWEHVHSG